MAGFLSTPVTSWWDYSILVDHSAFFWKNDIRIPSPVHTELLCWPMSWFHTAGHAALLSVQELVFQALDRFGEPLRLSIMFAHFHNCLWPYLQLHWQSSRYVSSLIHFQQSPTSLVREVRPQAGTCFQIHLKRFWPSDVHLPSTPHARLAAHSPTAGVVWDGSKSHQTNSEHLLKLLSLIQTCEWSQYLRIKW